MLRGNYSAKIDEKGRLKIPTAFRTAMQELYGSSVFVTSREDKGVVVNVYPLRVWNEKELKLAEAARADPAVARFTRRVNYYGQESKVDAQGRVSIHPLLRESAAMAGEVDVLGQLDHLEVWNHERFEAYLVDEPFTEDDARRLAEYGI